ncbi:MAG: hypothetical protein ACM3QZ_04790 [Solirubrobacterales bacterium]
MTSLLKKRSILLMMTFIIALVVIPASPVQAAGKPKLEYRVYSIAGSVTDTFAVEYADGKYVALCNSGQIFYSENGRDWNRAVWQGFLPDLYALAYKDGLWVAAGNSSSIVVSKDGIHWTNCKKRPTTTKDIRCLHAGKDKFVAMVDGGSFIWSKDGQEWNYVERESWKEWVPRTINYANGKYYAFGWDNGYYALMFTSPDGINWDEQRTSWAWEVTGAEWGNDQFLLAGTDSVTLFPAMYSSTDCKKVVTCPPMPQTWEDSYYRYGHGYFFAIDRYMLYWTKDGNSWETACHDCELNWKALAFGKHELAAFADGGKVLIINTDPFSSDLASLETSAGKLSSAFKPSETKYTLQVPAGPLTIKAIPVNKQAVLEFSDGTQVSSDSSMTALIKDNTTVRLKLTAPTGESRTYEIAVQCEKPKSTAVLAQKKPVKPAKPGVKIALKN